MHIALGEVLEAQVDTAPARDPVTRRPSRRSLGMDSSPLIVAHQAGLGPPLDDALERTMELAMEL